MKESDFIDMQWRDTFTGRIINQPPTDDINHPMHYTSHPSGVECIDIVRHMDFLLGNAVKYIWRCNHKGDMAGDLKKARRCIDEKIKMMEGSDGK